jgi:anti-sigma factor RsiW
MSITCDELDVLLPEFLDGKLTPEQEADAASHLATCDACTLEIDELQGITRLYKEHGSLKLPEESKRRIAAALDLDPPAEVS